MVIKNYTDEFDPNYYMNKYPDVKNAYGTNTCDLFTHFQNYGIQEGRFLNYNVEKQSGLDNPTFSQNYLQFDNYKINETSGASKIGTKTSNNTNDCIQHCNDLDDCSGFHRNTSSKKCHFFSGSVYPNTGLKYKSKRSTFIRDKINNTVCDAECKRNKKIKTLEEKYQQSLYNLQTAPEKMKNAKKKYIIVKNGEVYYQELYKRELNKEINNTIRKLFNDNNQKTEETNNSINDFKQKYDMYNNHLNGYLTEIDNGNKVFRKKLYDVSIDRELDARKSYYERNETDNLSWYSKFFTVLYYIIFTIYLVLFIINGSFRKPANILVAVIFLFLPYIWYYLFMKYLIILVNLIYNNLPRNVYYDI